VYEANLGGVAGNPGTHQTADRKIETAALQRGTRIRRSTSARPLEQMAVALPQFSGAAGGHRSTGIVAERATGNLLRWRALRVVRLWVLKATQRHGVSGRRVVEWMGEKHGGPINSIVEYVY